MWKDSVSGGRAEEAGQRLPSSKGVPASGRPSSAIASQQGEGHHMLGDLMGQGVGPEHPPHHEPLPPSSNTPSSAPSLKRVREDGEGGAGTEGTRPSPGPTSSAALLPSPDGSASYYQLQGGTPNGHGGGSCNIILLASSHPWVRRRSGLDLLKNV